MSGEDQTTRPWTQLDTDRVESTRHPSDAFVTDLYLAAERQREPDPRRDVGLSSCLMM